MITAPDFSKKQIIVVFASDGERIALNNSNLVVKSIDGNIKLQCTCYRLFLVLVIGHCSITTPLVQASRKFGFFIALMTPGFRLYSIVGSGKDGNTILHKKQYCYTDLDIAKKIIENKIQNQCDELRSIRNKNEYVKEAIFKLDDYKEKISCVNSLYEILAYEGLSSKLYFKNQFNMVQWNGRQPRLKRDYLNSALDIGYTLLFTFVDALLSCYGFDTYCGVMHTQFYMRKSLVCDIVEPFRVIIDHTVRKGIGLKQIQKEDFTEINHQYKLKYTESLEYVRLFLMPIIDYKDDIFNYIQQYYRAFMKDESIEKYPIFKWGE